MSEDEQRRLRSDFAAEGLVTPEDYRQKQTLEHAGFTEISHEDLSDEWAEMLHARLEMYRSLREETVARFGKEHFERYDDSYAFSFCWSRQRGLAAPA